MLTSCSSIIAAAQACIEDVIGLCTTAVATSLLRYMPLLYTGTIHGFVVVLYICMCICTGLFLLVLGLCMSAEYSSWWFNPVVSGAVLLLL